MSTSAGGLERAFRDHASGNILGADVTPAQLDAFRDPSGKLPADVFRLARALGSGRPLGAKNKRNAVLAQMICQEAGDPVLFMARLYAMPLDQVVDLVKAASPGSGKAPPGDLAIRALRVQLQSAKEVAQYVHSKKPVEANVKLGVDARVIIASSGSGGANPIEHVMRNMADAINDGTIPASQIGQIRIVDGVLRTDSDQTDDEHQDDGE